MFVHTCKPHRWRSPSHVTFTYMCIWIRVYVGINTSLRIHVHMCMWIRIYVYAYLHVWIIYMNTYIRTGWQSLIGSLKLQITFHKRATRYTSLLRKMTYKDKRSYESSPPCSVTRLCVFTYKCVREYVYTYMRIYICDVYMNTYIRRYKHVYTYSCTHVYVNTYICICVFTYVTYIWIRIHIYVFIYTSHIRIYTHMCI